MHIRICSLSLVIAVSVFTVDHMTFSFPVAFNMSKSDFDDPKESVFSTNALRMCMNDHFINIAPRHLRVHQCINSKLSLCVPAWATAGPRRMSERDLPSRLGHDATPQQIHSSKSVPALHSK